MYSCWFPSLSVAWGGECFSWPGGGEFEVPLKKQKQIPGDWPGRVGMTTVGIDPCLKQQFHWVLCTSAGRIAFFGILLEVHTVCSIILLVLPIIHWI